MIVALQATGATPWFSLEQELKLLGIGLGLITVLLVDRFIVWRLLRYVFRAIGRLPLLDIFIEKDITFSRWVEGLLNLIFIALAVLAGMAVAGVDISVVTTGARAFGLELLDWFRTIGVRLALILVLGYLANRTLQAMLVPAIRSSVTRGKSGTALEEATKRTVALTQVTRHAVRITIMLVVVLMVLGLWDINIGPLIAGLGVVGIAVGFGAQHTVKDIIAGAFIIAEDQYRVGDVASVAGKTAFVEGLNLRRTVLRDLDGVVHYIPNGQIDIASNLTKEFSRVNLDITVAYKEDLDKVIRVLNRVGSDVAKDGYFGPLILEAPRATRVNAFGDSGIDIKVLGVTKPIRQWEVAGEMRRRIKREFDLEGIEIPFPHRTIYWGQNSHPAGAPAAENTQSMAEPAAIDGHARELGHEQLAPDPWVSDHHAFQSEAKKVHQASLITNQIAISDLLRTPGPAALFVDIDGTLARINPNPSAVSITAAVRQSLNTLSRHMKVVALTGRQVSAARTIVGLNSITYVGNHGVEWWDRGKLTLLPEALPYMRQMSDIVRIAKRRLSSVDGLVIEDKGPTLSFHYRSAIDPDSSRRAIENFLTLTKEAQGMDIREGKMVVEVRPPIHVDKGMAVRKFVEEYGIVATLALGDDTTDIDTFRAIADLRESNTLVGACVAVLGEHTPDDLLARADYQARDVEEVELFLEWLAGAIS